MRAPTSTPAAAPPRCVRPVVYMANSHPAKPLRHAPIKQRVTVLRNLPIPCRTPDFGSQVAIFLFLLRRRRVAPVARHHGIGLAFLTPARPSVALGSSIGVIISISAP